MPLYNYKKITACAHYKYAICVKKDLFAELQRGLIVLYRIVLSFHELEGSIFLVLDQTVCPSIGIATYDKEIDDSVESVLIHADHLMYDNKRARKKKANKN